MQQTYIQHLPAGFDFTPIYGYINMNVTDQPRFAVILWLDVKKKNDWSLSESGYLFQIQG